MSFNQRAIRIARGRLRPLARPLYNAVVWGELAAYALRDRRHISLDQAGIEQVTAIVKTFERPREVKRLVSSIQRTYPALKLIIADDSREPQEIPGAQLISLPFNSGVSAGRRIALEAVQTPYLLLLDDDFVFYRQTRLASALSLMAANPKIDIMGGMVIDLPENRAHEYRDETFYPTARHATLPPGSTIAGLAVYDKVANFFIGRTERIRLVNWRDELRAIDHRDFFTRAKGVLTTVYNPAMRVLHAKNRFDRDRPERVLNYQHDYDLLRWEYYGIERGL